MQLQKDIVEDKAKKQNDNHVSGEEGYNDKITIIIIMRVYCNHLIYVHCTY